VSSVFNPLKRSRTLGDIAGKHVGDELLPSLKASSRSIDDTPNNSPGALP